jgi:hypothetical protein
MPQSPALCSPGWWPHLPPPWVQVEAEASSWVAVARLDATQDTKWAPEVVCSCS